MSTSAKYLVRKSGSAALLGAALMLGVASGATAQTVGESDIVRALSGPPAGATRSLTITPITPPSVATTVSDDGAFIESLRAKSGRAMSAADRQKLAAISSEKPTVNLSVPFGYNSATITQRTLPAVKALGAALSQPQFRGGTFTITGHTDARGSDAANQGLSERRADAVKRYLVQNYGIPAQNLISAGYGKSRLKNAADPTADENRRVEVTNLTDIVSASR